VLFFTIVAGLLLVGGRYIFICIADDFSHTLTSKGCKGLVSFRT